MLAAGQLAKSLHDISVKLYFFQGCEFELQSLCAENWSGTVWQDVQYLSARLNNMLSDALQARSIIFKKYFDSKLSKIFTL